MQQCAKDGKKVFAQVSCDPKWRLHSPDLLLSRQDCNTGLVQLVLASVLKQKIQKARQIYSRLTVDQLLVKVAGDQPTSAKELVAVLRDMVSLLPRRSTGRDCTLS